MSPNPSIGAAPARAAPLSVAIACDDPLARAALAQLLELRPELLLAPLERAEVVLWDAAGETRQPDLGRPLVALVADLEQGRAVLAAGARGVLLRDRLAAAPLASALTAVAAGLSVLDRTFAETLVPRRRTVTSEPEPLTSREQQVIALLAEGLSNRQIARRLGISEHTAKFHVNRVLDKLGVSTRTEAVVRAVRNGLLML